MRRRAILRAVLTSVLGAVATLAGASPASATTVHLSCYGNVEITLATPLTAANHSSTVDVNGALVGCVSPSGDYSELVAADLTGTGEITSDLAPCALMFSIQATGTFDWTTVGPNSGFQGTVSTQPLGLVLDAEVTSGPLAESEILPVPLYLTTNADCLVVGLTRLTSALFVAKFVATT